MGNTCTQSNDQEDIGASQMNSKAVGGDTITDDQLSTLNMGNELTQKLMLTISCQDLPNLDKKSKSDAFVVLWEIKKTKRKISNSPTTRTDKERK